MTPDEFDKKVLLGDKSFAVFYLILTIYGLAFWKLLDILVWVFKLIF